MIISFNNCTKKFNIDSSLIPEKGRLLQCNSCNHKWFFKKETIIQSTSPVKINKAIEVDGVSNERLDIMENENPKTIKLLDKQIKDVPIIEKISINKDSDKENRDTNLQISSSINKKNYNVLGLTIVFIISFVALIIVLDTFQGPISKIVPNIEFLLYNLYETINDIILFFKDLI